MARGAHFEKEIDRLATEASMVYRSLVLPGWPHHGMPDTLYGYMMGLFARIDLMSAHWRGSFDDDYQSERMVGFMTRFMQTNRIANSAAVLIWRHKLMHTAAPRPLTDPEGGPPYRWLLHWGDDHLPRDHHFCFQAGNHNLNLSLFGLIDNTRSAAVAYRNELESSADLAAKYDRVAAKLESYKFRAFNAL